MGGSSELPLLVQLLQGQAPGEFSLAERAGHFNLVSGPQINKVLTSSSRVKLVGELPLPSVWLTGRDSLKPEAAT